MKELVAIQVIDELLPGKGKKGPDEWAVFNTHPGQTAEGAAAHQPVKNGLGLVSSMVSQGNPPAVVAGGRLLEKKTAGVPTGFLQPDPPFPGKSSHGLPAGDKGKRKSVTEPLDKAQILAALRTNGMIEMSDIQGQGVGRRQAVQQMKEGDGVGATGHGDEKPVTGSDLEMFSEDLAEGVQHGHETERMV
jgi:hypothetical protein